MSRLRRIVMIRHGETVGESSVRFHGSTDVELSEQGRSQMRQAARQLSREVFDLVVASPLRRSWEAAWIVAGGAPVRLESDFREIDFGRWEGMTRQEIEAADPVLYAEWQARAAGFAFPGGEPREQFRARVLRGLERLEGSGAAGVLLVVHKGPIRTIGEQLLGEPIGPEQVGLGQCLGLSRGADGVWFRGRRSSDPAGLADAAA